MMGSKFTTQGWSKAVQNHDFGDDPQRRYTSATPDGKKEENVGDTLNKIANPSGKDTGGHKVRKAHNQLDKDDFLKLMLTQMKNQDPMNPMQSHEMAAQLAQFTSLEQLFNVNKNLEGLSTKQDPIAKFEALNFLGKTIKSDTRNIFHTSGENSELRFKLANDAANVKIKVSDEFGQPIKEFEVDNIKGGMAKVTWDGKDATDRIVRNGNYTFSVEAVDGRGEKVFVQTETKGTITGVNYTPEGPLLMIGDQKIRLQDIQKIEDAAMKENQNQREENQNPATLKAPVAPTAPSQQAATTIAHPPPSQLQQLMNNATSQQQKAVVKSKPQQTVANSGSVSTPMDLGPSSAAIASNGEKIGGAFGKRY